MPCWEHRRSTPIGASSHVCPSMKFLTFQATGYIFCKRCVIQLFLRPSSQAPAEHGPSNDILILPYSPPPPQVRFCPSLPDGCICVLQRGCRWEKHMSLSQKIERDGPPTCPAPFFHALVLGFGASCGSHAPPTRLEAASPKEGALLWGMRHLAALTKGLRWRVWGRRGNPRRCAPSRLSLSLFPLPSPLVPFFKSGSNGSLCSLCPLWLPPSRHFPAHIPPSKFCRTVSVPPHPAAPPLNSP